MNLVKRFIVKTNKLRENTSRQGQKTLVLKYDSKFNFNKYKNDKSFDKSFARSFSSKFNSLKEFYNKL